MIPEKRTYNTFSFRHKEKPSKFVPMRFVIYFSIVEQQLKFYFTCRWWLKLSVNREELNKNFEKKIL